MSLFVSELVSQFYVPKYQHLGLLTLFILFHYQLLHAFYFLILTHLSSLLLESVENGKCGIRDEVVKTLRSLAIKGNRGTPFKGNTV